MKRPFFSVCIPLFNRGETIFSTLTSLSNQNFKDFEVKIVVYKCDDNTLEEVERFFASETYKNKKFNYELKKSDKNFDDWNGPVKLACGEYIAMLEGDDQFLPEHLNRAFTYLSNNNNVGLYSTGNQHRTREKYGLIKSPDFFKFIYSMVAVPPPSETIFIRQKMNSKVYLYDHDSFIYAPEIDLYLSIADDGYDAFYDDCQNVWRYPASYKQSSWKHFHDLFAVLKKYKSNVNITIGIFNETKRLIIYRSVESYLRIFIKQKSETSDFKKNLILELGFISFLKYVIIIIIKTLIRLSIGKKYN